MAPYRLTCSDRLELMNEAVDSLMCPALFCISSECLQDQGHNYQTLTKARFDALQHMLQVLLEPPDFS